MSRYLFVVIYQNKRNLHTHRSTPRQRTIFSELGLLGLIYKRIIKTVIVQNALSILDNSFARVLH